MELLVGIMYSRADNVDQMDQQFWMGLISYRPVWDIGLTVGQFRMGHVGLLTLPVPFIRGPVVKSFLISTKKYNA